MNNTIIEEPIRYVHYTFDDILLVPKYSTIESRDLVSLTIDGSDSPVIPSNMQSIAGLNFAEFCLLRNYPFILHRYVTNSEMYSFLVSCKQAIGHTALKAISIGVINADTKEYKMLEDLFSQSYDGKLFTELNIGICIDVAHGHHSSVERTIKILRQDFKFKGKIIAGNVCTAEGAMFLEDCGADYIKVGVGNGSVCTTRLATGHGIPQVDAIYGAVKFLTKAKVIADGGVKTPGDIAKALAIGATYVMTGSMFAGTDRANYSGVYSGMASAETKIDIGLDPDYIEGVSKKIQPKGENSTLKTYNTIHDGLKSALSYSGAINLDQFILKASIIQVSNNVTRENGVHFNG